MLRGKVIIFTDHDDHGNDLIKKLKQWGYIATYFLIKDSVIPEEHIISPDVLILDLTRDSEFESKIVDELSKKYNSPIISIVEELRESEFKNPGENSPCYFINRPYTDNEIRFIVDLAVNSSKMENKSRKVGENSMILFDRAPIAYQSLDIHGNIIYVNDIWLEKLGYEHDEVVGHWFGDFLCEDYVDQFKKNFPKFKDSGEVHDVVFDMKCKNSGMITVSFDGKIGYDESGNFKQTHCIFHDISEKQMAEKALKKSEQYYKTIFENTGTATLIVEEDTKVSLVNAEFVKLYGDDKDVIEGKLKWPQFVSTEYLPMMREFHQTRRIDPEAVPRNYEFDFLDCQGKLKNVFTTVALIPGTSQSLVSILDITKQKKSEKILKTSLKDKETLLREIHHRVKNNLQIISSLLNLQSRYIENEDALDIFTESQNRVKSMAIIHEKLYKSKSMSKIDFEEYITDLTDSLFYSYHINPSKVILKKEIDRIFFDVDTAIPCGLMINELITNCLKHAFPGDLKGSVTVKLFKKDECYHLTVEDDGAGFPEDIDFQNTESLGLQLVNNLVNQLDGTIDLEGNNGTTFKVIFKELSYKKRV